MLFTTPPARRSSRAKQPRQNSRRHRADFARGAVFAEFGRAAFAIDQDDFQDRQPWEVPALAPEAGLVE